MPPLRHEQTSNIDWFNAHFRLQTRIPSIPKKTLLNKTSWTRNHSIASRKESQRQRVLQYPSREGNENQTQTHTFLPVLGLLLISHWWLHLWVLPRALYMYFFFLQILQLFPCRKARATLADHGGSPVVEHAQLSCKTADRLVLGRLRYANWACAFISGWLAGWWTGCLLPGQLACTMRMKWDD